MVGSSTPKPMLFHERSLETLGPDWRTAEVFSSTEWMMQEKLDGHRHIADITVDDKGTNAINYSRSGARVSVSTRYHNLGPGRYILDGELIGATHHLFDLIGAWGPKGEELISPHFSFSTRYEALKLLFERCRWSDEGIALIPTLSRPIEKIARFDALQSLGAEGVVFRKMVSPYVEGKTAVQFGFKLKFTKTVDVIIVNRDGERDAGFMALWDPNPPLGRSEHRVVIGRVSLYGKKGIEIGDVVEVRYLYASHPQSPYTVKLIQPRVLRRRLDKAPQECTHDQLLEHYPVTKP